MRNQRALVICQRRFDAMEPPEYRDNPMDYDEEEAPFAEGAEEEDYYE